MAALRNINFCSFCGSRLDEKFLYGKLRPWCPTCRKPIFLDPKVAAGVVIQKEGSLLLVQRKNPPFQGCWTLPAGFVDAGEDPRKAAERECFEETGLVVEVTHLIDSYFGRDHSNGADFVLFFAAKILSGDLLAGDDASNVAWFQPEDYPELAFPSTHALIASLR